MEESINEKARQIKEEKRTALLNRMNELFGSESTDDTLTVGPSDSEEEIIDDDYPEVEMEDEEEEEIEESEEEIIEEDDDEIVDKVASTPVKEGDDEVFCICRSSDIERFMIACEKCNEWFHGDCINVSRKKAKSIEEWFCFKCLEKDSKLKIKYKVKTVSEKLHKIKEKKLKKPAKQSSKRKKLLKTHVLEDTGESWQDQTKEDWQNQLSFDDIPEYDENGKLNPAYVEMQLDSQAKRRSRRCGKCTSCRRTNDCRKCDYCKDSRKYGGPGKLRQKCRVRQCEFLSNVNKRSKSNSISSSLNTSVNTLDVLLSTAQRELDSSSSYSKESSSAQFFDHSYSMSAPVKEEPVNLQETSTNSTPIQRKKAMKVKHVQQREFNENIKETSRKKPKKEEEKGHSLDNLDELYATNRSTRSQKRIEHKVRPRLEPPKQCLGPGCINAARKDSKYCSDDCGIQLQMRRLQVILPEKMKEMKNLRCVADDKSEEKIAELKKLQKSCEDILHELDEEHKKLEEIIERANNLTICNEEINEEALDTELDLTTDCVSCGMPLGPRIAFKHMEKCWSKLECLMSFGAMMPSAGNLFCDTYMPSQQTYCKRLRVICPEHFKDKKRSSSDICGCPLEVDELNTATPLCRTSYLKCTRHVSWERLWRAEIDLKRVHQWWKLEESLEQERQLRIEMKKRNNVLGILLHSTIEH